MVVGGMAASGAPAQVVRLRFGRRRLRRRTPRSSLAGTGSQPIDVGCGTVTGGSRSEGRLADQISQLRLDLVSHASPAFDRVNEPTREGLVRLRVLDAARSVVADPARLSAGQSLPFELTTESCLKVIAVRQ